MKKYWPRLFVALTTFAISVPLTYLIMSFRSADLPAQTAHLETLEPKHEFSEDEKQLLEIYREYGPAQTRHDRNFFEKVETDDFILFLDNQHISREENIREMEESPSDDVYDNTVDYLEVLGEHAVVHGRVNVRYVDDSVETWRFIDVCVKSAGVWKIQSTTSVY